MVDLEKPNNQNPDDEILCLTFNQDYGCFACGTQSGFKIYNTYPFKITFSRELYGGIGIVEMLYRCNILALVGGGKNPKYPLNKVMIWDDHQVKCIGEISFRSSVKAVKLRPHRIVVVLENKIYVYNFSDLKLLDHIETCPNPKGLCSLNTDGDTTILACPDKQIGFAVVIFSDPQKTVNIKAHQSSLSCVELNPKGAKVATASEKGTVIRIYNTEDGALLQEVRRGSEYAQIYSIAFETLGRWLACSSDSGTIHIFSLKISEQEKEDIEKDSKEQSKLEAKNPKSKLSFMKYIMPYFDSEWSFAQFKVPDTKTKVAFGADQNNIIVISQEGNYYTATFDIEKGGTFLKQTVTKLSSS